MPITPRSRPFPFVPAKGLSSSKSNSFAHKHKSLPMVEIPFLSAVEKILRGHTPLSRWRESTSRDTRLLRSLIGESRDNHIQWIASGRLLRKKPPEEICASEGFSLPCTQYHVPILAVKSNEAFLMSSSFPHGGGGLNESVVFCQKGVLILSARRNVENSTCQHGTECFNS